MIQREDYDSSMKSLKPYLVRAYYEWICDNNLTPHLLVQANLPNVIVPVQFIDPDDGTIVLNISAVATNKLIMNNKMIQFQARFDNVVWEVEVPMYAVGGIYAEENEEGAYFAIELSEIEAHTEDEPKKPATPTASSKKASHPHLRVVKNEE